MSGHRPHPLSSAAPLTPSRGPSAGSSVPAGDLAAVAGLKQAEEEARRKQASAKLAEEEREYTTPKTDVPQPRLSDEAIAAASEYALLMSKSDALAIQEARLQVDDLHRNMERNRVLEARLPAISLSNLLFHNFVEQRIPVTDEYVMTFRTIDAYVEVDAEVIARELAKILYAGGKAGDTAPAPEQVLFCHRVATLVCGLVELSGAVMWARRLHDPDLKTDVQERRRILLEKAQEMLDRPPQLLMDLFAHQALFTGRVRRVFSHAGYVSQETGNS